MGTTRVRVVLTSVLEVLTILERGRKRFPPFKVRLWWFGASLVKLQYLLLIMGFERAIYQMIGIFFVYDAV